MMLRKPWIFSQAKLTRYRFQWYIDIFFIFLICYSKSKKILEEQKNSLLKEVMLSLDPAVTPGVQTFSDLGDQASAESDRNFYIRLKEREQKLIKKIDAALEQIENGTL